MRGQNKSKTLLIQRKIRMILWHDLAKVLRMFLKYKKIKIIIIF